MTVDVTKARSSAYDPDGAASSKRVFLLDRRQWGIFLARLAVVPRDNPALPVLLRRLDGRAGAVPTLLTPDANIADFSCGVALLDRALKLSCRQNAEQFSPDHSFTARSFALTIRGRVVGYYSLRRMALQCRPAGSAQIDPIVPALPLVFLARLAVDTAWHHQGLGADLLSDAVRRGLAFGETFGACVLYVHAVSEDAKRFYLKHGFTPVPAILDPLGLIITAEEGKRALGC